MDDAVRRVGRLHLRAESLIAVRCSTFVYSQDPGPKLLHDMIWRDETSCGSTLVSRLCGLPTRIDGEYQTLTSCESVRFLLSGMLESRSELFEHVSQWESFRSNAAIGTVVSRKRVAALLNRRNNHFLSAAKPLHLQDAIEWEIGDAMYCDPDLASRLGQVISGNVVIESDEWDERQDLETMLRQVKFKGRDGKFHIAVKLLCPELYQLGSDFQLDSDEEQFRSQFAPSSCLLSEDYDSDGVTFFDACRGRMEAPSRLMAEWVLKAGNLPRQKAALQYIAHGQQTHTHGTGSSPNWGLQTTRHGTLFTIPCSSCSAILVAASEPYKTAIALRVM